MPKLNHRALAPASQLGFASVDIWGEMQTFHKIMNLPSRKIKVSI